MLLIKKKDGTSLGSLERHIPCTLQLLCFGAEIDEKAIEDDKTKLLRPIENRLKLLRDGKRMGTSLMSEEERRFMWNLAYVLAVKHPAIAFGTYRRIHACVTFHGIFMVPGFGPGERKGTQWRCLVLIVFVECIFLVVYCLILSKIRKT